MNIIKKIEHDYSEATTSLGETNYHRYLFKNLSFSDQKAITPDFY